MPILFMNRRNVIYLSASVDMAMSIHLLVVYGIWIGSGFGIDFFLFKKYCDQKYNNL